MLQQLREHATGPVAIFLLGAIALSFVFFGIDFGAAGANVGLRVNGEEISRGQVDSLVRQNINRLQQSSPQGLTPDLEQLIRDNSVTLLVNQTLIEQSARSQGYRVSDEQVADELRAVPDFQVDGRFDAQVYYDTLAANNRSAESFEAQVRDDLERRQIFESLERTSFVTTAEVQRRSALTNQIRTVDYLQIPLGSSLDAVEVTEEEIQQRYEDFADIYTQPETVEVQYVELLLADVAQAIEVDETELKKAYENDKDRFTLPDERRVRHILIASTDERSPVEARERADELLAEISSGSTDFETLAQTESDDPLSAPEGGDLGWVSEGALDDALIEAAFATEAGAIAGPVQTSFGWHLLKVEEARGGEPTPYDDVREQLLSEIRESRADGLFIDRGDELSDLVFQNAGSLEPAAEALGLELKTVAGVSRSSGRAIASNADVRQAIFSASVLEDGLNSEVVELEFGHLAVLRVIDRTAAKLRPLDEVRASIVSVLEAQKAREAIAEQGETFTQRLRDGEALSDLAAELASAPEPVTDYDLTRRSREVPTQLVEAVFAEPTVGEGDEAVVGGVPLVVGDYVVYRLTGVKEAELSAEEGASLRDQLAREHANLEFAAFVEGLRERADVFVARDYQSNTSP